MAGGNGHAAVTITTRGRRTAVGRGEGVGKEARLTHSSAASIRTGKPSLLRSQEGLTTRVPLPRHTTSATFRSSDKAVPSGVPDHTTRQTVVARCIGSCPTRCWYGYGGGSEASA